MPKSIKIVRKKMHMKFWALNIYFDSPSHDFLGSRERVHHGIKERYPSKGRLCGAHFKSELRRNGWRIVYEDNLRTGYRP